MTHDEVHESIRGNVASPISKAGRSYVVTPLLQPEYTTLQEISSTVNHWAILKWIIHRLEALGVRPPASSRLNQACNLLEKGVSTTPGSMDLTEEERRRAGEACRLALEFWVIVKTLTVALVRRPAFNKLLQRSYMGRLDPEIDDQTSERARDAQFELWLGAWFAMGNRPVRAVEPDLRVTLWFDWYAVAAKRVRSASQLLKRVQKAADQILSCATKRGFIAISLDNYRFRAVPQAGGVGPGKEFFEVFPELDAAESWLMENAPWVRGTLSFGLLTSWESGVDGRPAFGLSALERVILLNSEKSLQLRLAEVLHESRLVRQQRWQELERFASR